MAGHSKWNNIQHRKGAQDAKRGKMFTKLIREITTAARLGGEDINSNPRLRAAIDKALSQNMTKDTIQRAVKRGAGGEDATDMMEIVYEGYGPAGVAVLVECLTDNKNRTVAEVRHAFSKCGGNLGTTGSVAYLFEKTGLIHFNAGADEEKIMEIALEAGAEDISTEDDGSIDVTTTPDEFIKVRDALVKAGLKPAHAEVTLLAATQAEITDIDQAQQMMKLNDMLEDLDDVQNVNSNAEIAEALLNQL